MKRVHAIIAAIIVALSPLALSASQASASVEYGCMFHVGPLYGPDDPSNAGQNGDILTYDSCDLQGAQFTWDQSTYTDGTGTYYELILKNDNNGKMCVDDRGGVSGGTIAIKYCNESASQAWYATCYYNTDPGAPQFDPILYDGRGKAIHYVTVGGSGAVRLGVPPSNQWPDNSFSFYKPTSDFPDEYHGVCN